MRIDKLTTKFQEALADAQSLAVGRDNPYIEPAHVLAAMLTQVDGPRSLLERAGARIGPLSTAMETAIAALPQVQGQGDGERILKRIEQRARAAGLDSIFVLTTRTMHWFIKRGFAQVDPDWLPEARKRKYNWDRRSQVLVKTLN